MTTFREHVKSLSGLAGSKTLREHLLAITQTGGAGRTVFASQFSVRIEEPRLFAVQRPKREVSAERVPVARSTSREENERALSVLTTPARTSLLTAPECLIIHTGTQGASFVVRRDGGRMTVKQSEIVGF